MKYPKELLRLERQAFALTKAMPDMKAAHDKFWHVDDEALVAALEAIEIQYGLNAA